MYFWVNRYQEMFSMVSLDDLDIDFIAKNGVFIEVYEEERA